VVLLFEVVLLRRMFKLNVGSTGYLHKALLDSTHGYLYTPPCLLSVRSHCHTCMYMYYPSTVRTCCSTDRLLCYSHMV